MVCHLKNQKLYGGLKHENQDKQNKQKIKRLWDGKNMCWSASLA
jgi:hypothetical protein